MSITQIQKQGRRRSSHSASQGAGGRGARGASAPGGSATSQPTRLPVGPCEKCGGAGVVRWLAGYREGQPVRKRLCMVCASTCSELMRPIAPARHLRLDSAMALAGFLLVVLGGTHDFLPRTAGGFGWQQLTGVMIGAVVLILGLFTRADYLAAGGLVVLGFSGTADLLHLKGEPGFGWKQEAMIICGLGMILLGLRLRWLRRRTAVASAPNPLPSDKFATINAKRSRPDLAVS